MERKKWTRLIKKACTDAGTYKPYFDSVIDTLAGIMEARDRAQEQYEEEGAEPVITHVNRNGAENVVKNPALVVVMDCNAQALSYWRDLGLTPSGLRKLNEEGLKQPKMSALAEALSKLDG
jgi:hypothetical protein